jgi:hypothetical protein
MKIELGRDSPLLKKKLNMFLVPTYNGKNFGIFFVIFENIGTIFAYLAKFKD